jgi:purine catabolism regulator
MSGVSPHAGDDPGDLALPTLADVLTFDSLTRGHAEVVAGAAGLDRRVRWAHISELPTIAEVLRGGELVITTGIALPTENAELADYVRQLAAVGASGLIVGLGPRFVADVPPAMTRTAEKEGLPLVMLRRFTRFVDVTEDIHSRIVDAQVAELLAAVAIHQTFTEMAAEGIGVSGVLRQVAQVAACPVVLENLMHQVLAFDPAGRPVEEVIGDWEARSREVHTSARTEYHRGRDWLVAAVGARGRDWGRLILLGPGDNRTRMSMLAERAATTLALGRLIERDLGSMTLHVHGNMLAGLISPDATSHDLSLAAKAVGVTLEHRQVVGLALRLRDEESVVAGDVPAAASSGTADPDDDPLARQVRWRAIADAASRAARQIGVPALVGLVEDDSVLAVLLSLPLDREVDKDVARWVEAVATHVEGQRYIVGVGTTVSQPGEARRSLVEAMDVAEAALGMDVHRPFVRSSDLRLRGLLQVLRGNLALQSYAERELGPLLEYDRKHGTSLVMVLRSFLECGRNKTAAAEHAHVSRPWMYERLARVERVLGVDLTDEEVCVSLQVALMAWDNMRA